ncbi:MAG: cellulase family glycosylhydrolase [Bacteroidales bacterium]|jgi:hypothetical protein|nr:glycoside hydrolase family 5 protein [Bacteroidales bacterium]
MKHIHIYILIIVFCLIACERKGTAPTTSAMKKADFIYIEDNTFKLNEDSIFIVMLNYVVDFRDINGEFVLSPYKAYENPNIYEYHTKEAIYHQIEGHFQLIKELGFNTVRLCFDRISCNDEGKYFFPTDNKEYFIEKEAKQIIESLKACIHIATEKGLRVMLLIKPPIDNEALENFTVKILREFQNNPTIFAYDFMNEPLYFDAKPRRAKTEAMKIVRRWKQLMSKHAPNQLLTIGFSEPIEVFEWDPYLLDVDFIQIHTYHPLRVPNEIYWYSQYMNKPWMIGETALPADNDSVSYEHQRQFMIDAFRYTVDCGGCGFGWWDFQESVNTHFEAQYSGLLNHKGITFTKDGDYTIKGTLKPAAYEINQLKSYRKNAPQKAINYYNMLGYGNFCVKGIVLSKTTQLPVEGAVIRGWNEDWSIGMNTFTNEKGEFTLYSNDECVHFEISAPGMSEVKFYEKFNYQAVNETDINKLNNRHIEYHMISYFPFLEDTTLQDCRLKYPIFTFDSTKFFQYQYLATIKAIYLTHIPVLNTEYLKSFLLRYDGQCRLSTLGITLNPLFFTIFNASHSVRSIVVFLRHKK